MDSNTYGLTLFGGKVTLMITNPDTRGDVKGNKKGIRKPTKRHTIPHLYHAPFKRTKKPRYKGLFDDYQNLDLINDYKYLGKDQQADICARLRECRGVVVHLFNFIGLAYYADRKHKEVSYGICKRQLSKDSMAKVWANIRRWLNRSKSLDNIALAVSIGWRRGGICTIRYIACDSTKDTVNESSLFCDEFTSYLNKRLGFRHKEAINGDTPQRYLMEISTMDEFIYTFGAELMELFLSSILLYGKRRTYTTEALSDIIKGMTKHIPNKHSYASTLSGAKSCIAETVRDGNTYDYFCPGTNEKPWWKVAEEEEETETPFGTGEDMNEEF